MKLQSLYPRSSSVLLALLCPIIAPGQTESKPQLLIHAQNVAPTSKPASTIDAGSDRGSFPIFIDLTRLLAQELVERVGQSSLPVQFENVENAPLTINDASVAAVDRGGKDAAVETHSGSPNVDWVVEASIALSNNTSKQIKGVALYFLDRDNKPIFAPVSMLADIEAYSSVTLHKRQEEFSSYWIGRPEQVMVRVGGVCFEDWTTWGVPPSFPAGPPEAVVDTEPDVVSPSQPQYTDEARERKVEGTIRARVLVGADGAVKSVKIVRSLPFGLAEQAIQSAYQIRFRPAFKSGLPVAYWIDVDIEFRL